jgi:DNA (cytosine-5)-methyltransferase 1
LKQIVAIDLFCGAGGLTSGLSRTGINVVAGYDIESSCDYAYETNNPGAKFYSTDVSDVSGDDLKALYPDGAIKLLAGCAPCQPFSTYSQGRDARSSDKWPLLNQFARLIEEVQPELVTMENVPDVIKHEVYHDFVACLKKQEYEVSASEVYCPNYGIPQRRKRQVLLASKLGKVNLLPPTHTPQNYETVRSAISHFPAISAGEQFEGDRLHRSAELSDLNVERIKHSKPGGSWRDWPEHLLAECHKRESGKTYGGVYARMEWNKPAPTMTTQCFGYGNGRFGHPEQNRAISLREAASIQTFSDNYKFIPDDTKLQMAVIGKMIGNAVPPKLGEVIGRSFVQHVGGENERPGQQPIHV